MQVLRCPKCGTHHQPGPDAPISCCFEKLVLEERKPDHAALWVITAAAIFVLICWGCPYNPNQPALTPEEELNRGWEEMNDPYDQVPY